MLLKTSTSFNAWSLTCRDGHCLFGEGDLSASPARCAGSRLPVGDSGLRYRLSQLLGIRRLTCFWSDVLSSVLSGMLTSFLQVQRPCIQPVQTLCSLMFQANVLFSQIIFMLLKVHHFQILYSISILELFRVSACYECLNIKVEQLIENRNIARFISEKVMWLLLVINY